MDWNLIVAVAATVVSVSTFAVSFLIDRRAGNRADHRRNRVRLAAAIEFRGELTAVHKQLEQSKSLVIMNPPFPTVLEPDGSRASLATPAIERNFDLIGFGNLMVIDGKDDHGKAASWSQSLAAA